MSEKLSRERERGWNTQLADITSSLDESINHNKHTFNKITASVPYVMPYNLLFLFWDFLLEVSTIFWC